VLKDTFFNELIIIKLMNDLVKEDVRHTELAGLDTRLSAVQTVHKEAEAEATSFRKKVNATTCYNYDAKGLRL
jgi:hypothetical protein